jgi:AraC-like DNA-binding protein
LQRPHPQAPQRFWANPTLPHLELRSTADGRSLHYGLHSHPEFSIGLVSAGRSVLRNSAGECAVGSGDLVLVNAGEVHACRALDDQAWAYSMLFVDTGWLAQLQTLVLGRQHERLLPFAASVLRGRADLAHGFRRLVASLEDAQADTFEREQHSLDFFTTLVEASSLGDGAGCKPPLHSHGRGMDRRLRRAIDLLHDRYSQALRLADLSEAAGLSATQLTRLFRAQTGLTPHAYLVNVRVQRSRALLREGGLPLAEIAATTGFADQAHLQRHYRRLNAVTPGAYRRQVLWTSSIATATTAVLAR